MCGRSTHDAGMDPSVGIPPFCGVLDALCIEKPKHIAFRAPATFQKVVSCHQIVSFPRKSGKPRSPNIDPTFPQIQMTCYKYFWSLPEPQRIPQSRLHRRACSCFYKFSLIARCLGPYCLIGTVHAFRKAVL